MQRDGRREQTETGGWGGGARGAGGCPAAQGLAGVSKGLRPVVGKLWVTKGRALQPGRAREGRPRWLSPHFRERLGAAAAYVQRCQPARRRGVA